MSVQLFRKIHPNKRPKKLPKFASLKAASCDALKIEGVFEMDLNILGKIINTPVYVCSSLNQEAILGMDAIRKANLNFDVSSRQFHFQTDKSIQEIESCPVAALTTKSLEKMPALTARPLRLAAFSPTLTRPLKGTMAVASIISEHFPLLAAADGLVTPTQNGEVTIWVKNCHPYDIDIPRGEIVGYAELIDHPESVDRIDSPLFVNELNSMPTKTPPPLSTKLREEFLKDLNLTVPNNEEAEYIELILKNHDVFSSTKHDLGLANNFQHEIKLRSPEPVFRKQFRIPESHRDHLEKQVKEWLKIGIIEPSNSRFNSPIFVVPKKDGTNRFVLDYRALNDQSLDDRYTMKDVNECIGDIGRAGSTIFSTMDLTSGFWQLPLDVKSKPYTSFTVPGMGQYQYKVLSMGLKGGPGSFQRMVELTVKGLENIIVYIDDLLVHSHSHKEHRIQLQQLFDRLRKVNLKLNLKKCEFGSTNVSYLGFRLTPEGIIPGLDKLKVVRDAKPPSSVTEIRQFLGLCNFFRSHVRNFSMVASHLTKLTCKNSGWRGGTLPPDALKAFNELKTALVSEPVVAYPRKDRPYALIVDAATGGENNAGGMGAILCQQDKGGNFHVIAYASRSLQKHEMNYTPFLSEMMAAVWGMNHFDVYLRGKHFTLFTDHRPLEKLGKVHTKTLNRLQEAMNTYDFTIVYKKGKEMPADFLSRNVLNSIDIFTPDLPQMQAKDEFCSAVMDYIKFQGLPMDTNKAKLVRTVAGDCFIEDGILWRRLKRGPYPTRSVLVVPRELSGALINEAHGGLLTGHGGMSKTKERLLESYYWPNMDKDIMDHINVCKNCQVRRTDDRPLPQLLSPLPQCTAPNQRMHMDLFGPLKTSDSGKKYVLCMTDAFSKYAEMVAVPNKEAGTVSSAIFNRWICRYGTPLEIVTDGGKEFVNQIAKELYKILQVEHSVTTPAHPQCNAQAEVANKTIAKYLSHVVDSNTLDWELYLPPMAFSYNTTLHRTVKATPFS